MNKKATRLSSIALAFMMVFAVAVALFPAGAALAAGVEIIVPDGGGDDTTNVVEKPATGTTTVTVKVTDFDFSGDYEYDGVYIALIAPGGNVMAGKSVDDKLQMTKVDDKTYTYKFTMQSTDPKGMYRVSAYPYKGNNHYTIGAHQKLPAFYYADPMGTTNVDDAIANSNFAPKSATEAFSPNPFVAATTDIYVAPEAKANILVTSKGAMPAGVTTLVAKYFDQFTGKVFKEQKQTATGAFPVVEYTIPKDAAHGTKVYFGGVLVSEGDDGQAVCEIMRPYAAIATANVKYATVDSKGPEIDEIAVSADTKVLPDTKGYIFEKHFDAKGVALGATPKYYIEIKKATDADSGLDPLAGPPAVGKMSAYFYNVANKSDKIELDPTSAIASNANNSIYKGADALNFPLIATDIAKLVPRQWKLVIVAEDGLGNKTEKEYGNTIFAFENYFATSRVRVSSRNALEMYKGQKLTIDQLEERNVVAGTDLAASYGDAWTWAMLAANDVVTFDAETGTITAVKSGDGRLYVKGLVVYNGDLGNDATDDYLEIRVTDQPTVSSLKLNTSGITIKPGEEKELVATVVPDAVKATWESKDPSVATVDANGKVKGVKNGTTVIVAKAGAEVATCTVEVKGDVAATGITLSKSETTIAVGSSETILASTTPEGGVINWATSDATIAVVDNAGKITANKAGTATITATSGSASATVKVTVVDVAGGEPNTWGTNSNGKKIYFGENGQAITGWKKIGGYWYLFDYSTAEMKTGWAKDGGAWYYLQADGKMKTGWLKDGTKWYYLQGSGAMKTGWLKDAGKWYYLHRSNGDMQLGWVKDGGIWYYLNSPNGDMKANQWLLESGVWYYLQGDGAMCANATYQIDGRNSKFASSGRWLGYV